MSNVTLQIGARSYTVACAAGEERHVSGLGRLIDEKVQSLGGNAHSEVNQLLFVALLLADELHETRAGAGTAAKVPANDPAETLEVIAARLETCASALEQQGKAPYMEL